MTKLSEVRDVMWRYGQDVEGDDEYCPAWHMFVEACSALGCTPWDDGVRDVPDDFADYWLTVAHGVSPDFDAATGAYIGPDEKLRKKCKPLTVRDLIVELQAYDQDMLVGGSNYYHDFGAFTIDSFALGKIGGNRGYSNRHMADGTPVLVFWAPVDYQ